MLDDFYIILKRMIDYFQSVVGADVLKMVD